MRSNTYTLTFTALVTIVLGIILSLASTALKERQNLNVEIDKKKNILRSLDFSPTSEKPWTAEVVKDLFANYIDGIVVDKEGNLVEGKLPADLNPDKDIDLYSIYIKKTNGKIDGYAIPISGKGLWSTLYGYFAVEPDGKTVKGITFYKHGETPGLGAEVEKEWFLGNFVGKRFIDGKGNLVSIQILKGKVDKTSADAFHQVDGISGATLTTKGINSFLAQDLKTYEPFFKQVRTGSEN